MGSQPVKGMALGATLAAAGVALLYLAGLFPIGRLAVTAVAGLMAAVALMESAALTGWLCYGATGLLGLLLVPEKGVALLYLLLFGLYPLVKSIIESLRRLALEWVVKILYAALSLYLCLRFVPVVLFLPERAVELGGTALFFIGLAVFIVYDLGLSALFAYYQQRIRRRIRRKG